MRIERYGPPTGGMTALTRDPSGIRASTTGWATESSRPARAAIRSRDLDDLAGGSERDGGRLEAALAFDEDLVRAVDQDVADQRVVDERLQRPEATDGGLDRGDECGRRVEVELGLGEDLADRPTERRLLLGGPPERVEHLGREARDEHPPDGAQRGRRERAHGRTRAERSVLTGCLRGPASRRGRRAAPSAGASCARAHPPSSGQAARATPTSSPVRAGAMDQAGSPRSAATVNDRIRADPPEQRHVRLAREPLDLGVIVRAVGDDPELATHPLARSTVASRNTSGQRLERGSDDAQDDVGLVDELAVAVLEDAAEVGHQQVIPGALGALEQRVGFDGTEDAQPRLSGMPVALGELGVGREGEDVDAPPRRA